MLLKINVALNLKVFAYLKYQDVFLKSNRIVVFLKNWKLHDKNYKSSSKNRNYKLKSKIALESDKNAL